MLKMKRLEFDFMRFLIVSSLVPLFLVLGMPSPAWSQKAGTGMWCNSVVVETPRGEVTAPGCAAFSVVVVEGESFSVRHGFIFESVTGADQAAADAEVALVNNFQLQASVEPDTLLTETARMDTGDWAGSDASLLPSGAPGVSAWTPSMLNDPVHLFSSLAASFTCEFNDCILHNGVIEVTYTTSTTGAVTVQNPLGIVSDGFLNTMTRVQVATINIVSPRILADLRLNSGVAGGTLELTAVIPVDGVSTTLVTNIGRTCIEEDTCRVDASFSGPVNVIISAFPSTVTNCAGAAACMLVDEGALPIDLNVVAAAFTNGEASIAVAGVQYNLENLSAGDGAFRIDVMIDGSTSVMRVNVGADQTPPTVPAGFALSCASTEPYQVDCSWPAGVEDPSPGAGLADFVVTLSTTTPCAATSDMDNPIASPLSVGVANTMTTFVNANIVPGAMYLACLTVVDAANNMATDSPFQASFMAAAYDRMTDSDENGLPDDWDVFNEYTDLIDAINRLTPEVAYVAIAHGIPPMVAEMSLARPVRDLDYCNPDYARNAATANLETSCADALLGGGGSDGWIIHVNNGEVYPPTAEGIELGAEPRYPGLYLISRLEGQTATLVVLPVLPQLGIMYPVEEGYSLAPPDENPTAQPSSPTVFQVGALFGEGAIISTVTLSIAIMSPDGETALTPTPDTLTVALQTLFVTPETGATTETRLARFTGIKVPAPEGSTAAFTLGSKSVTAQVASFTLADEEIMDLDFIRIMLADIVYASSETNIVCSTPQEGNPGLAGAPDAVMPGPLSCTIRIGGDPPEVEIADSGGGGGMLGWLSLVALAVLTMLSGLVRRRGIAVAAALFLAAGLSPAAFAQPSTLSDPSHWRLGVDIGLGLIEPHGSDVYPIDVDDDSDFGWRISLEHDSLFHKDVGLEIFWADLGEAEVSSRENPENFSAEVEADIFGIGVVWHLRDMDFAADWSPYVSLGYRYVDGELSGRSGRDSDDATFDVEHENGVYWNIGVEGSVYRDWNLLGRVFYEAYDEDLGFWGVGLVWHLGESSAPPRKKDKAKARQDRKAKRSASRQKAKSSASARQESSRRAPPRRDMAAAGECQVPKGMTPKGWYVQVITYASADRARSMQAQLTRDGYTAGVADRGGLYAVRAVTDTCAKAQRIKRQLRRKLGVEPFVRPYESHVY